MLVLNQEEPNRVSKINRNTVIVANCLDEAIDYKNKPIEATFDYIFVGNLNERKNLFCMLRHCCNSYNAVEEA